MTETGLFGELIEWFSDPTRWSGTFGIPNRLIEHVIMSALAVAIAAAIALPLGMYIGHKRRFEKLVVSITNTGRAIPSFGLLFLFVLAFGIGLRYPAALRPPIIFALVLLAIPPILTNTYVGIQGVEADTLEAARGMGMRERSVLLRVEVPLAAPLMMAGLRTAAVQVVATATLAAVVAGGGLGRYLVDGFATRNNAQILGGAILVAALAILTEVAFALTERAVSPRTSSAGRAPREEEPWLEPGQAPRPGEGGPI